MTLLSRPHLGNVDSSKEEQIWVIREKEIKARRNSRKRPSLVRRTNEERKKKRRTNKCPVLSGVPCVLSSGCWCSTTCWRSDWQPPGSRRRPRIPLSRASLRSPGIACHHARRGLRIQQVQHPGFDSRKRILDSSRRSVIVRPGLPQESSLRSGKRRGPR